ncbi:MAG: hypothetical protein ACE37F_24495 [Nannocystaceae bacterium]|nr:hypothetical protein [bacterium]
MHLVSTQPAAPSFRVLPVGSVTTDAPANDSGAAFSVRTHQVNTLVAGVVGQVAARVQSKRVNIALRLAAGDPTVATEPGELAFVVGAILGAALRIVEEERGEYVGVQVAAARSTVRISVTTDGVPPLRFVRALDPRGTSDDVDPTLAHCRRLIEACGGALVLTEHGGRLGFALEIPRVILSPRIRLLPDVQAEFGARKAA